MKYSFVIIAFNEAQNIRECIGSILIQNKLNDSYEIVVVDDGSTDKTVQLVNELIASNNEIKLICDGKNHGRGYSRWIGTKNTTGQYIAFIDADIILPKNWLTTCLDNIKLYDVVGGIALPDGDVAYIHRKFLLAPKIVQGSTVITGNNGFYKKKIFMTVNFNKDLRNGEDVDFNIRALEHGFREFCIPILVVEHSESKNFITSVKWLFESGQGATRQLKLFRVIRIPDLAFIVFILLFTVSLVSLIFDKTVIPSIFLALFVFITSYFHIQKKFYFPRAINRISFYFLAIITNTVLISSYFVGRTVGLFKHIGRP